MIVLQVRESAVDAEQFVLLGIGGHLRRRAITFVTCETLDATSSANQ
jgi:hypothetical protein